MKHALRILTILFGVFFFWLSSSIGYANDPGLVDKTAETVNEAAKATNETLESLWQSIDQHRLVNRSRDEIIAWLLMGVLVGSSAGMLTKLKATGAGRLSRLGLGLAGAFLGGMVVRIGQINFEWGIAVISYEELVFSLVGAVVLIFSSRLVLKLIGKKKRAHD